MPSRSTGCRTCVGRRVRCDERKPACERCEKAGRQCAGFPPGIQFVNETESVQRKLSSKSDAESSATARLLLEPLPRTRSDESSPSRPLADSSDNRYFTYLLKKFWGTGASFHDVSGNRTWMAVCMRCHDKCPTSRLALQGLAAGYFGQKHKRENVLREAARLYGRALVALRQLLLDPIKAMSFDTLAATFALQLYEYVVYTSRKGWIQHVRGVSRLIELHGPDRFLYYPDRAIFQMNRQTILYQSLAERRRSFLEKAEWRSIAWIHPEWARPPMARLEDIFCEVPGLAEDIQRLEAEEYPDLDELVPLQQKASRIVQELHDWQRDLAIEQPNMIPKDTVTTWQTVMTAADKSHIYETVLEYSSHEALLTYTIFNTFMVLSLGWEHKSRNLDWQRGDDHEGYLEIPAVIPYAHNICRSIDAFLQEQNVQSGCFCLLFPSRVAYHAMPRQSSEAQCLANILELIADTTGLEIARNVLRNVPVRKKKTVNGRRVMYFSPAMSTPEAERVPLQPTLS